MVVLLTIARDVVHDVAHHFVERHGGLLVLALFAAHGFHVGGGFGHFRLADDDGERGAAAVCLLHLALEGAGAAQRGTVQHHVQAGVAQALSFSPFEWWWLQLLSLAVLAERAGLPAGVFNVITSKDSPSIGREFTENDKVRKLTFTGSTDVGKILMRQGADQIMKLGLELGGNAPFIVFDDADLDAAVEGAMVSKYRNNGQTCVCANRLYVQSGVYDAFAEKLAAKVSAMKVGDGFETGVNAGPLITRAAVDKVEEHIADALEKGAKLAVGGKPDARGGLFFQPTILTGVTTDMKVAREETFGPVAPLFKFDTEEQVIA
eukprot:gene6536-biopygen5550